MQGLDIGEVDLIVCYDVSKSPIRLVQRMGRTGRKRAGRIIVLVTEVRPRLRPCHADVVKEWTPRQVNITNR